jgi:hypothetical protein
MTAGRHPTPKRLRRRLAVVRDVRKSVDQRILIMTCLSGRPTISRLHNARWTACIGRHSHIRLLGNLGEPLLIF